MKKTQLKALLKVIIQEVVAAKQKRIDETKRLSGLKKSKYSTPVTPQKAGNIKEEIIGMIREAISEMARTAGAVDPQYRKEIEPGKWVIMGHPNQAKYPDGSPTTAPKGPYQKVGTNPNIGRPPSKNTSAATPTDVSPDVGGDEDDDTEDETAPETTGGGFNSKIEVVINGDTIGELDLAKIKGSVAGYLSSMLRANDFILKLDPSVNAKLDEFSDLFVDDKLPTGSTLDLALALGSNSIKLA
jgi:hypothetical protein